MNAREIFLKASELASGNERDEYVKSACNGNVTLRRQVQALLAANDDPDSFLDHPPLDFDGLATQSHLQRPMTGAVEEMVEEPGSTIDNYKLLQEIGHGGFGVVYMAEQEHPVRRQVALKIIKPGMDTREVIARFEAERQALALMDHPNIAKVFDAGATSNGRPYFVMELVKGVPITEFCDKNKLTTRKRLELFVAVCNAVQHAHQKGVIHRDIKPSNVMITLHDGKPVPKVIDFGISKAISQRLTEKTLFTRYGQMIGTPQYMSPEQAEMSGLDVDTRSDVYSLGVLLYELLTGTTPLQADSLREAGYAELLRMIQEDESPKPSLRLSTLGEQLSVICQQRSTHEGQVRQLVRGDLDWIAMKALEKDRGRRYETANGLAEDVQRHLEGNPVMACPPTFAYRFSKFTRRYRSQVAVAAGIVSLLAVSSVVAWYLFLAAQVARDDLKQANEQLVFESDRALESEQEALRAQRELEQTLYDETIVRATTLLESGQSATAKNVLETSPSDLRNWEWQRLHAMTSAPQRGINNGTAIVGFDFSSSHNQCAITDASNRIRLVDSKTKNTIWERESNVPQPAVPRIAGNGNIFVVTEIARQGLSAALEIWSPDGDLLWKVADEDKVYSRPMFSPDGRLFALSRAAGWPVRGTLEVRDMETFALVSQQETDFLGVGTFSHDSQDLLMVTAKSWNLNSSASLVRRTIEGQTKWSTMLPTVGGITAVPGSELVIVGGKNHRLTIVDAQTGDVVETVEGPASDLIIATEFNTEGTRFLTIGTEGSVVLWDWPTKDIVNASQLDDKQLRLAEFTPDGDSFWTISDDHLALEAHAADAPIIDMEFAGATHHVIGLCYDSTRGELLSFDRNGILRRWDAVSGLERSCDRVDNYVERVDIALDRNLIACATLGGIKLLRLDSLDTIIEFPRTVNWWHTVKISPDGTKIIGCHDTGLELCDTNTGTITSLQEFKHETRGVEFIGNDQLALVSEFGRLDLFKLGNREKVTLREEQVGEIAGAIHWMPQTNRLVIAVGKDVEIWNVTDQRLEQRLVGSVPPAIVTSTVDERRILVGDINGTISIWNLETGKQLVQLAGHDQGEAASKAVLGVQAITWSDDGETLFSGDRVGRMRAWESNRPSLLVNARRMNVKRATDLVDRLVDYEKTPDRILRRLKEDSTIPVDLANIAAGILKCRSGYLQMCATPRASHSISRRLALLSDWRRKSRQLDLQRRQLDSQIVKAMEQSLRLGRDDTADLEWNELIHRWSGDSEVSEELTLVATAWQRNHPMSPYGFHALAVCEAARSNWERAHQLLLEALACTDVSAQLDILLEIQAAAIELQLQQYDSYKQRCRSLLERAKDCKEPRLLWRIARTCVAQGDFADQADAIKQVLDRVPPDELPDTDVSWFHIVMSQWLQGLDKPAHMQAALQNSQDAFAQIVEGRLANYARSTAAYQMREAAKQVGDAAATAKGAGAHNFILQVQPFVRPISTELHRSWEEWLYHKFLTQSH